MMHVQRDQRTWEVIGIGIRWRLFQQKTEGSLIITRAHCDLSIEPCRTGNGFYYSGTPSALLFTIPLHGIPSPLQSEGGMWYTQSVTCLMSLLRN